MTDPKILAHSLTSKERTKDVLLTENVSFSSLILPPEILQGLTSSGFEKPSPIQVKALPVGRCGFDLIVKAKSGTGKTLVFAIICLETVKLEKRCPQVLILAPAREIAVQIQEVIKSIGQFCKGLSVECFIGGLPLSADKAKCKTCHIAVGTPGRIKQLIQEGDLPTNAIKVFILDEADKLTENSFVDDINEIYNALPDRRQIIMSSATFSDQMQEFLSRYMRSPVTVTVELETPLLLGLRQYVRLINAPSNVVQQTKAKNEELLKVLSAVPFVQCLVFSNYQNRAESIRNYLNRNGWSSVCMSSSQKQTERLSSLSDLKEFKLKILITTDLTARGIDAPNVDLVVNYDVPFNAVTYLHRMGRAGRYGATGNCINLAFVGEESKLLQHNLGFIGGEKLSIPVLSDEINLDFEPVSWLYGEQKTDFQAYTGEIHQIRSSLIENCPNNKRKKKAKPKDVPNGALEQIASGSFELNAPAEDTSKFLQQLADNGEISDLTPSKSPRNETLSRNKALCTVAKILSNTVVSNDDYSDVSAYISTLKSQENTKPPKDFMENIFSYAYESQVKKGAAKWQDLLNEDEKEKLKEDFAAKDEDYDEDYDFEVEKEIEVNCPNDYSFMEWVPVEPHDSLQATKPVAPTAVEKTENCYSYHEQYRPYYEHCSSNLWHSGLSFSNVEAFDRWFFEDWESQLSSVRNFVQQKVYFEEMSRHC